VNDQILFENVSKFYGEILGVNRVNLSIPRGITSLVGPNGSGKTTLMNLMTGLIRPTRGRIQVLGCRTDEPEKLFRILGYSTQFDSFPKGLTGYQFIYSYLRVGGRDSQDAEQLAWQAIERVNLAEAATRKIAGYSKGMRQRIRLAQALCHDPRAGARRTSERFRSAGSLGDDRAFSRGSRAGLSRDHFEPHPA
jgi:ABC-2 type transport system ATP-binding protein